ncbi:hypothetical protein BCP78_0086 [Bacillus phage BCP78]|uniref:Uncharacterized protein n=3 Tax=Tsarbombavirus BCP78 TaxID=1985182 RepID=J9PQZ4_9CAUD|nr:hypothetical protein BCP78_0086 [Bacillus phage BCP78]YP_009783449.1 hypothetical protein QLX27_gp076 [Bacillus phage BCU4]ALA07672.1 hypothetical protein PBC6_079 [Bacillus phage PBC6]AQN32463.1 hypothetical protein BCP12_042 [Bacillus phage BCP12]AEW47093.1 hypothetical protein BCP78_0086 [Bacillus phage BCP78]AEW47582.1 hypothetical protein BCU4_0076 [Bacillus phage BCU4]
MASSKQINKVLTIGELIEWAMDTPDVGFDTKIMLGVTRKDEPMLNCPQNQYHVQMLVVSPYANELFLVNKNQ